MNSVLLIYRKCLFDYFWYPEIVDGTYFFGKIHLEDRDANTTVKIKTNSDHASVFTEYA